ncbi:hypothetical protein [Kosmotoga pacifica]|uniref:Uncharacterized protein n=1 Tax=Kosmotoga pacifica TaxID=1330330 RepID=A0A0G2Z4Q3_9BACT|nr:hypothetical protein [Kosmotoga pacifica]AKI96532.1 hypothetical protein IX53_00375 [Kosmotoga pacifica]
MRKRIFIAVLLLLVGMIFAFGPELRFGSLEMDDSNYFIYMFHYPVTDIVPGVDLDFGFNMYQTEIGGPMYFGRPNPETEDSTNFINGISIYGIRVHNRLFDVRYGIMNYYSRGIGLLLDSYRKANSWAFDGKVTLFQPGVSFHIPFEITSLNPFNTLKTSSLWFGGVFLNLPLNMLLDATFLWESNSELTALPGIPAYGMTLSLDMPIVNWKLVRIVPSAEAALLSTSSFDAIGFGAGVGGRFSILDLLWIKGGLVYYSKNFIPGYYDADYEYKKLKTLEGDPDIQLPSLNDATQSSMGWFVKANISIGNMLLFKAALDSYNTVPTSPILRGYLRIRIPEINLGRFGGVPEFYAEAGYYQSRFPVSELLAGDWEEALFNENARFLIGVIYPLAGNMAAHLTVSYNPAANDWEYGVMFDSSFEYSPGMWLDPEED